MSEVIYDVTLTFFDIQTFPDGGRPQKVYRRFGHRKNSSPTFIFIDSSHMYYTGWTSAKFGFYFRLQSLMTRSGFGNLKQHQKGRWCPYVTTQTSQTPPLVLQEENLA